MSYLNGAEQFKKMHESHSALVIPQLQSMVSDLIDLVENNSFYSFEFSSNMTSGNKPEKLTIFITPSQTHRKIQLGSVNHNIDMFKALLDENVINKIMEMHDYVSFINDYLPNAIPTIRRPTKYRKDSETKTISDQPKIPDFSKS